MSDLNAVQALEAEIVAANPQTDSKEQVTPAVTASPEVEDEEGTDDDAGEEAGESEVVTDENGEPLAEQPKRKSRKERAREKVNAEIARRIKAEQELQELRAARDQAEQVKSQQAVEIDETPKTLADFAFNEDAYHEYKADQKLRVMEAQRQQESEAQRVKQAEATFAERAGKFREETATDFDEVALKTPLGPRYTLDVVEAIRDSDVGPQLAYYLGQNLAETEQLLALPATQRARAIGKIEARLEADTAPATASRQAAANQPPRTVTRAPAIGSTVHAASPGKKSLADWDIKDHIEKIRVKR